MKAIFALLSLAASLGCFVCWILVLVDAFKKELWKGFVGLLCGFYALYYAFTEYTGTNKQLVTVGWLGFTVVSIIFSILSR